MKKIELQILLNMLQSLVVVASMGAVERSDANIASRNEITKEIVNFVMLLVNSHKAAMN